MFIACLFYFSYPHTACEDTGSHQIQLCAFWTPFADIALKKGLDMVFWDKAQPVILRGKKVLVHQQQNQLFKGIFTCQSQGSEREYFPIARGPFYIEFIFSRTALPCLAPQYQCWQKIFLGRPICFSFPAIRPFLHTHPKSTQHLQENSRISQKMLKLIFHWNSCKFCLQSCSDE